MWCLWILASVLAVALAHNDAHLPHLHRHPKYIPKEQYHRLMSSHVFYDASLPYAHSLHDLHPVTSNLLNAHRNASETTRHLRQSEITPLFPGYGTHYAYVYVGVPPQRQSVIIDTGSHYTGFPCTGCQQCGTHTDPYYDLNNSTTAIIPKCLKDQKCLISQSYTEGSSWHGFKVQDRLWVGGVGYGSVPQADSYSVNFVFACQTSETGLFRTQLADGIMGMSNTEDTLPWQLFQQKVTETKMFALCYRIGGGMLTLGGVDQRIHSKNTPIQFVKSESKMSGWYNVMVKGIQLQSHDDKRTSIPFDINVLNAGKGVIVDSGTTDTYLPSFLASKFMEEFRKITGFAYASTNVALTSEQFQKLPTIVFELESADHPNQVIEITMPKTSYVDSVGGGKYAFRVYLTEKSGAVLGANFMTNYNVIFDVDGKRLGFAKSTCNYEEFAPVSTGHPSKAPTKPPSLDPRPVEEAAEKCDPTVLLPYTECSARCDVANQTHYRVAGTQSFIHACSSDGNTAPQIITKPCYENCTHVVSVRGPVECPDSAWTDCSHACIMSKQAVPITEPIFTQPHNKCNYRQQTTQCYAGLCPRNDGDYLLYVDMRMRIEPSHWSSIYSETCFLALTRMFGLKGNNLELLNNAGMSTAGYASMSKLHFQIRLKAKDYTANVFALHNMAEKMVEAFRSARFAAEFIRALDEASIEQDKHDNRRFGWLLPSDVEVLSAVALPIGDIRDPYEQHSNNEEDSTDATSQALFVKWILIGVTLGILVVLLIVVYLHVRLRREYDLMSKDKSTLVKSSEALRKMWARFAAVASSAGTKGGSSHQHGLSREALERELEMSQQRGLMQGKDEDEEGQHE